MDIVKRVLVKDAQNFDNRTQTADEKGDPLTAKGIFALKDKKWKHIRIGMTPIFTSGKVMMFYLTDNCAKEVILYLDKKSTDGEFQSFVSNKPNAEL